LVVSAHKAGLREEPVRMAAPRLDSIAFESEHQYMATLHRANRTARGADPRVVYLKGSVERVLERCHEALGVDGVTEALDPARVGDRADQLAAGGLRVLAFARMEVPAGVDGIDRSDIDQGFTFLGLQGMIDPPRPEAIEAVDACRNAGISVRMITGDHPVSARAISAQLGITTSDDSAPAVSGPELAELSDDGLEVVARDTAVFARVSPEQKLRLVDALQGQNEVVAMTGDGVNDSPALKQADIGVAMGLNGTDAAKDAADMVLTDDNFASIRAAIEEGRGVFDNLIKFIVWTLPTNLGEALVVLIAVLIGTDLPITPVQILWINMSTAIFLGLMLAFEPGEPGIMQRPPRDPSTPILTGEITQRIAMVGGILVAFAFGLYEWELALGASVTEARTVAVNTFVMIELAYLFNCRSMTRPLRQIGFFSNPWVWAGSAAMITAQLLLTYLPTMQTVFGTTAINPTSWLRILAAAAITFAIVSIESAFRRRRAATRQPPEGKGASNAHTRRS
jgi:magnesium-transporting ATPase (P-type)